MHMRIRAEILLIRQSIHEPTNNNKPTNIIKQQPTKQDPHNIRIKSKRKLQVTIAAAVPARIDAHIAKTQESWSRTSNSEVGVLGNKEFNKEIRRSRARNQK